MDLLNNFSIREKNLWSELLVDLAVSLYYFPKMFLMMRAGEAALTGAAMTDLVTSTVMVAIFVVIIVSIFLHYDQKPEQVDERDLQFELRGSRLAYYSLVACIVLIMGFVVIGELGGGRVQDWLSFLSILSPVALAHLLLLSLMLSSAVKTVVQLYYYRRGF